MEKIGFGGSCHWCTEAIFRSLRGVNTVEQGWISPDAEYIALSEAVVVHFEPSEIRLENLIAVHFYTHSCTSDHELRNKYRSAIYIFSKEQEAQSRETLAAIQQEFSKPIITKILPFDTFKLNEENYLDYYYKDPTKPFCQNIVNPKLKTLLAKFGEHISPEHAHHLASI